MSGTKSDDRGITLAVTMHRLLIIPSVKHQIVIQRRTNDAIKVYGKKHTMPFVSHRGYSTWSVRRLLFERRVLLDHTSVNNRLDEEHARDRCSRRSFRGYWHHPSDIVELVVKLHDTCCSVDAIPRLLNLKASFCFLLNNTLLLLDIESSIKLIQSSFLYWRAFWLTSPTIFSF